jgi:hypothetical protein
VEKKTCSQYDFKNPKNISPLNAQMTNLIRQFVERRRFSQLLIFAFSFLATSITHAFDHTHSQFDSLLKKHVIWDEGGHNSRVNYFGFKEDQEIMKQYLETIAAVSKNEFESFNMEEQLVFLINTYNAYTVFWVSQHHETIHSIKDLGSFFKSPWKYKRFNLLGKIVSLDYIEHQLIRKQGRFDEPRIHMVINCASIGCPALRPEAYQSWRIEEQLHDSTLRFLSDRSRNFIKNGVLFVSPIFKWYKTDFKKKSGSVLEWLKIYSFALDNKFDLVNRSNISIKYSAYDWSLNTRDQRQNTP